MTEPLRAPAHMPSTLAEERGDGSVAFFVLCSCGWRGDDHDDELPADDDRWQHIEGYDQTPDGSWINLS